MKIFEFLTIIFLSIQAHSATDLKTLIFLGDSVTEGYGVEKESAYPALVQKKINAAHKNWKVINAGVSGSTSQSASSRFKWLLKQKPDLVVIALGANDGLRGFDPKITEKNLDEVLAMAKRENIKVILAGMMMPPNYGVKYTKEFSALYPKVAKKYQVKLIPFLLEGVAGQKDKNLADGIHPNEKGHEVISEMIYKGIENEL